MRFFISSVALLTISLFTLAPTFNLALFGDDWLTIFRYLAELGPKSSGEWNHITYFLTSHGPEDMFNGLMNNIFGFNAFYYYLTSYILRITASISLYFLSFYLTKNKLASFFAALFFSITTIGLETTIWVFNAPSYVSITFFCFFLYFYIKSLTENKLSIASFIFFALSYIAMSIRMHGLLPFVFATEAIFLFSHFKQKSTKKELFLKSFLRISIFISILLILSVLFIAKIGFPAALSLNPQFNMIIKSVNDGKLDFISIPILTFGEMIIPLTLQIYFDRIDALSEAIEVVITLYLISLAILLIVKYCCGFNKSFLIRSLSIMALWSIFIIIVYLNNKLVFSLKTHLVSLGIGGYIISILISLILELRKQKNLLYASLFISLVWSIVSFYAAWMWGNAALFGAAHRYLIVSAVGVSLIFAILIDIGKNLQNKIILFTLLSVIIILNIISSRNYINQNLITHNQKGVNKIWSTLSNIEEIKKSNERFFFYFEGDGSNQTILSDSITFGFSFHMGILYNITEEEETPGAITDWDDLVAATTTGKTKVNYVLKGKTINPDLVYAYHLEGKDRLIDITDLARSKLKEIKSQY